MKRIIGTVALLAALLLTACGATAPDIKPEAPLLAIDGEVLIDGARFALARAEQRYLEEKYQAEKKSDAELFKYLADYETAAYLARAYGVAVSREEKAAEWAAFIAGVRSGVNAETVTFYDGLRAALGLSEADFADYETELLVLYGSAEALAADMARDFITITEPALLAEKLRENLSALLDSRNVVVGYPGLEGYAPTFEYVAATE